MSYPSNPSHSNRFRDLVKEAAKIREYRIQPFDEGYMLYHNKDWIGYYPNRDEAQQAINRMIREGR